MRRTRRPLLVLVVAAGLLAAAGLVTACSSSPRSQAAFCRQGPVLRKAKQPIDASDANDLVQTKRRMATYNAAIQKAVSVAPDQLAADIEPLGKLWDRIDAAVQRARSTDEVTAATQDLVTRNQASYERSSQAVYDYIDQHCTTAGGTK